jgi:hypothetical protein
MTEKVNLNKASFVEFVGNRWAQRRGRLRKRWSLRQAATRERCSSSEPLCISGALRTSQLRRNPPFALHSSASVQQKYAWRLTYSQG